MLFKSDFQHLPLMSELNIRRRLTIKKPMTYILGANCEDGIVFIADKKVTNENGNIEYRNKLYCNSTLVIGTAGPAITFPIFRDRVLNMPNIKYEHIDSWFTRVGRILHNVNTEYDLSLPNSKLEALVGVKTHNKPVLKHILISGIHDQVQQHKVIGSGEPYGSLFLNNLPVNMTMMEYAEIGYFIINCIETNKLTDVVGVGNYKPQVCFIPNDANQQAYEANSEQMQIFEELTNSRLSVLETNLGNLFKK